MRRNTILTLFVALIGIGLVIASAKIKELIDIDRCLDSGGKWNYETKKCEH